MRHKSKINCQKKHRVRTYDFKRSGLPIEKCPKRGVLKGNLIVCIGGQAIERADDQYSELCSEKRLGSISLTQKPCYGVEC